MSFYDAISGKEKDHWISAIKNELENLYSNSIMSFTKTIPKDKKPIDPRWVFTKKYDGNNVIEKYKARLVAKGYKQIEGRGYDLT